MKKNALHSFLIGIKNLLASFHHIFQNIYLYLSKSVQCQGNLRYSHRFYPANDTLTFENPLNNMDFRFIMGREYLDPLFSTPGFLLLFFCFETYMMGLSLSIKLQSDG